MSRLKLVTTLLMTLFIAACSTKGPGGSLSLGKLQYVYVGEALRVLEGATDGSGKITVYGEVFWDLDPEPIDLFLEPCGGVDEDSPNSKFRPAIKLETNVSDDLESQLLQAFEEGSCVVVNGRFIEGSGSLAEGGRLGELQEIKLLHITD